MVWHHTDALDLESCKNALVEDCHFDTAMMASVSKAAGMQKEEKRIANKNVIVKNCVVYHAHGGFVVGSEMSAAPIICL